MSLRLNYRSPHVQLMMEWRMEQEFKMPPVGITETRCILGGRRYIKYTLRCDVDGCWLVADGLPTREAADKYLLDHKSGVYSVPTCPAPPRRESLPSGLKYVEKLWRELDEVLDSLALGLTYREGTSDSMEGASLKGYAKGLSFTIVMMDSQFFPDLKSVARHAAERRKMRLGEMDFSPTPSRFSPDATVQQVDQLHDAGAAPPVKPVARKVVPDNIQKAIKAAMDSSMFTAAELAETYKLTVDEVNAIASK